MALTVYLAKVIGLALILVGGAILLRTGYFIDTVSAFARERLTRFLVSVIGLIAGLALVVGHNVWNPPAAAIITLLGWMAVVESLSYLLLPDTQIAQMLKTMNRPPVYYMGGLLAILVGAYLAGFGFGYW